AGEAPVETMVAEQLGAPGESHLGGNEVAAVVPRRAGIAADVPASEEAAGSGAIVAELRVQVESVCVPLEAQVVDLERGAHGREGGASAPGAGLLRNVDLRGVSGQRGGGRVDGEVSCIGALEVASRPSLGPDQCIRRAKNEARRVLPREGPGASR